MENQEQKNEARIGGSGLNAGLERLTHEDLRKIGEQLDKDDPQGLGEKLLCFADDWRMSLFARNVSDEMARRIAVEIVDPWLNSDPCGQCKCDKVCMELHSRIVAVLMRSNV